MPVVLPAVALAVAATALIAGCRGNTDLAPELLKELSAKQGEVMTLTTILGVTGSALVVLGASLAVVMYARKRPGGDT